MDMKVETILKNLYPEADAYLSRLCLIYNEKRKQNIIRTKTSLKVDNPYEFGVVGREEIFIKNGDGQAELKDNFIEKILSLTNLFMPNKLHT